jgi:hypothetical protein
MIQRLTQVIRDHEGSELDYGTIRTLGMIDKEAKQLESEVAALKAEIERLKAQPVRVVDAEKLKSELVKEMYYLTASERSGIQIAFRVIDSLAVEREPVETDAIEECISIVEDALNQGEVYPKKVARAKLQLEALKRRAG